MAIKIISNWQTLMSLAKAVGDAKKTGDVAAIQAAEKAHDDYKEVCLRSDSMNLGVTWGRLREK